MRYLSELINELEIQDISYKVTKNGNYITVDYSGTTVDARVSNLRIISITTK